MSDFADEFYEKIAAGHAEREGQLRQEGRAEMLAACYDFVENYIGTEAADSMIAFVTDGDTGESLPPQGEERS